MLRRHRNGNTIDGPATPPSPVVDLDDETFFEPTTHDVTIVDFWATWCGPCTRFHPTFERVAARHSGSSLRFARLDVDRYPAVAAACMVASIPTLIALDADLDEIGRLVGVPSRRQFEALIATARAAPSASDPGERPEHGR